MTVINIQSPVSIDIACSDALARARRCLWGRVVVLCGAGISTASGIPDFRSDADEQLRKASTVQMMRENPAAYWKMVHTLHSAVRAAKMNMAHKALIQYAKKKNVTIITQNVDRLLGEGHNIIEMHGRITAVRCTACGARSDAVPSEAVPACSSCGQECLRSDMLLYGESDPAIFKRCFAAVEACDTLIVVGSSLQTAPASYLPACALNSGKAVVLINNEPTALDSKCTVLLRGQAEKILPLLLGVDL